MNENNEIRRKVFIDYENFMGAVTDILKNKSQSSRFGYSHFKKFLELLAQDASTEISCYYEPKDPRNEKQSKTRLIDYFPILEWQLEKQGINFDTFSAGRVSVDSRIFAALATMVRDDTITEIYLVSGDGDYAETLQVLSEQKKVVVVSGEGCCSGLLKEVADEIQYIDDKIDNIMSS